MDDIAYRKRLEKLYNPDFTDFGEDFDGYEEVEQEECSIIRLELRMHIFSHEDMQNFLKRQFRHRN